MEDWLIITLIIVGLIVLFTILFKIIKRRKEKRWFLFEKIEGYENNPKIRYFAVHKKTREIKPVYLK